MNKNIIIIYCLLFALSITAFPQKVISEWAFTSGGPKMDGSEAITSDSYGNIIVTGYIQSKAKFDTKELNPYGDTDIFLAKYSKNGKLIWVKNYGSTYTKNITITESGNDVAVDSKDNIYIVGRFAETANFTGTTVKSAGGYDIFFAKIDKDGDLQWVKSIGNHLCDISNSLYIDKNDNIYVSGTTQGTLMLGDYLMSTVGTNAFIAKYSVDGYIQWVKHMQTKGNTAINKVTGDDNCIYFTGYFGKELFFEDKYIESKGDRDLFLVKLNNQGELIWIKTSDECTVASGKDICIGDNGIYIVGDYTKWLAFDDVKIMAEGSQDIFIARLNNAGELIWIKSFGGPDLDRVTAISKLGSNEVIVSGMYSNQLYIGDTIIETEGLEDVFLASYDLSGRYQWIYGFGSTMQDRLNDIYVDKYNDIYLTGFMRKDMLFDNVILNSNGGSDIFIGKLANYNNESLDVYEQGFNVENIVEFELYPNPCNGLFTIYSNPAFMGNIQYFEIRNALGESVQIVKEPSSTELSINISNLPSGVYFIEGITKDDDVYTRRLVKI